MDEVAHGPARGPWPAAQWLRAGAVTGVAVVLASVTWWVAATPAPTAVGLPDSPPYDEVPGRVAVADLQPTDISRQQLAALLPPTGRTPGAQSAAGAAGILVGRWCRTPATAAVDLTGVDGYRRVGVRVTPSRGTPFEFLLLWQTSSYLVRSGYPPSDCG